MANKISLCMIIRNEENNLRRCLQSVRTLASEIIIVDTGSTDRSLEIAREYSTEVFSYPWQEDFSEVRNLALAQASGDWILIMDADEELAPESLTALSKAALEPAIEGYFIKIINYLGNEGWGETCPDLVFRFFRNRREYRFRGAIHEQIAHVILENNSHARFAIAEGVTLLHYGYLDREIDNKDKKKRNLSIIERELEQNPNDRLLRYHYGVELYRLERYPEAAAELIRAANGIDPNTLYLPKLLRYIVLAQQAAAQPEEALRTARLGLQFFPDYADLYYYSGLICLEQKKYAAARDFFLQAVSMPEQQPQYASFGGVRGFRSYYHLGNLYEFFNDEEEALKYYVFSLRDNPNFSHALEKIIKILNPLKEPDYTEECLDKVCDFCTPQAHLLVGEIYFRQGAFTLALKHFDQAKDLMSTPERKLWRAICLIQDSRYLEALILLDQFRADSPLYPLSRINKLFCYWLQDKPQKAALILRDLERSGLYQGGLNVLSLFTESSAQKQKTDGSVQLGKEESPFFLEILQRILASTKSEQAGDILKLISKPSLISLGLELGSLFYRYGRPEEALLLFLSFIKEYHNANSDINFDTNSAASSNSNLLQEHLAEACFLLAEIYRESAQYQEAEQAYRRALEESPDLPRYYLRLISLYEEWKSVLKEEA